VPQEEVMPGLLQCTFALNGLVLSELPAALDYYAPGTVDRDAIRSLGLVSFQSVWCSKPDLGSPEGAVPDAEGWFDQSEPQLIIGGGAQVVGVEKVPAITSNPSRDRPGPSHITAPKARPRFVRIGNSWLGLVPLRWGPILQDHTTGCREFTE
jgi:hypothetical protein